MAWDLSNYETVEDRIDSFYKDNEDGRILTEIHTLSADKVIFKALVYIGEVLVATGFAYEKEGSSPVNKTSHIENAETSAIGRALANYNYAKKGARPSREEMEKVVRMSEPSKTELENDNDAVTVTVCNKCPRAITLKVAQFSIKKYGKPLCMKCQESEK
jgi:hypothetical protein